MQAFGITFNRYSVPILYLACAIVGFLLIRESVHMFHHPIATRAISVWLELGFIILSLPAIRSTAIQFQSKSQYLIPRQASLLIITWLAWTLISTLLGNQPWAAMVRWFEILSSLITAFCLYILIRQQPKLIILIIKAIVAAVLLCIFAFIVFWNIAPDPVKHNWVSTIPFFMNIRHFGYLAAVAIPVGYWLLERNTAENKNIHWVITYLILSWALVFWLGGRGTFLAASITTLIYVFIAHKQQIKWIALSPLAGLIISQFFIVDHPSLNLFRFIGQEGLSLDALSSFRATIYQESLAYWWQQAPILGIGADGYRYIMPAIGNVESIAHPHSSIIQLLLSYGPIGLLIPAYFFYRLTWQVIKSDNKFSRKLDSKSNNRDIKTLYLILLSTLIVSLFDGILYHAYGLFISTIVAGMCIALVWPLQTHSKQAEQTKSLVKKTSKNLTTSVIGLSILLIAAYYLVFSYQLYHSKYGEKDEQWINWNARYPLYFSPTWTYERYNVNNIEQLKQSYIERSIKLSTEQNINKNTQYSINNKQQDKK
jgi:O-antigen ligase